MMEEKLQLVDPETIMETVDYYVRYTLEAHIAGQKPVCDGDSDYRMAKQRAEFSYTALRFLLQIVDYDYYQNASNELRELEDELIYHGRLAEFEADNGAEKAE